MITAPDSTTTTHQYGLDQDSGGTLYRLYDDVADANGHHARSRSDIYGRRYQVLEYNGASTATTTYLYSPLDLLTNVTDANGNVTNIGNDSLGRKTSMSDPDMGVWCYTYKWRSNRSNSRWLPMLGLDKNDDGLRPAWLKGTPCAVSMPYSLLLRINVTSSHLHKNVNFCYNLCTTRLQEHK